MAEMEWKRRVEAPKDGRKIVIWYEGFGEVTVSWSFSNAASGDPRTGKMTPIYDWMSMGSSFSNWRFWRPQSAPPSTEGKEQGQ